MRRVIVAVALAVVLAGSTAVAAPKEQRHGSVKCATQTAQKFRPFSAKVWRLGLWERDKPEPKAVRAQRKRLKCARSRKHLKAMRRTWRSDKAAFYSHRAHKRKQRRLDAVTPFGDWAIPGYIVMCESGGDFGAYNPNYEPHGPGSGPGGAYQIIASTWAAYGGTAYAPTASSASAYAQHVIATRIWAAEGSSPWECA